MNKRVLPACLLVILASRFSFAQEATTVWFKNKTDSPLTVRCFSQSLDVPEFSKLIKAGESVGTHDLATGQQVIGVWGSGEVNSVNHNFQRDRVATFSVEKRNGQLVVRPSVYQLAQGQTRSHFHSQEWKTHCQASDGNRYPVSVDFKNRTYTTQTYRGQFSDMTIRETEKEWSMSGRWSSPSESGSVSFIISKANLNNLSGSYTIDGNTTAYQWNSK